jgi:hypothetical protein
VAANRIYRIAHVPGIFTTPNTMLIETTIITCIPAPIMACTLET